MTTYLLDTNHLSPLVTVGHSLRTKVLQQQAAGDSFGIPSPVLSEFLFGIGGLPRARQNLLEWQLLKADFVIYSVVATQPSKLDFYTKVKSQFATIIN